MERPTLSQSWNRVAKLTPVMRPRVEIRRQLYRGEPWYVVHDIVSNSFFRLNPVAYHLVGLFDGKRTVDEVWNLTLDRFGDEAPTQDEVIALLGQLNSSNLLRVDLPPDAEQLLYRAKQRKVKQWGSQALNILFMRIPVFNPEPMLKWLTPLVKPLLNRWGMLLWSVVMIIGLLKFVPHWQEFYSDSESVLAPANWHWLIILFILTKAIHELGHGVMCKAFGGEVPEIGVMLLVLFPAPYVDATASWNFPDRWKRLAVAGAGMQFELFIAAICMFFWPDLEAGLAKQLCHNTIFLASITTILFNANPLIRFDGYYMLSDLLEIPNMYERAKKQMYWVIQRFAYGIKSVPPVSTYVGESFWLFLYGIASLVYRVLLLTGIVLFIMGKLFAVGLILALWSMIAWGVVPLGKFLHWLFTAPLLARNRKRAVSVTAAAFVLLLIGIGVIRVEEHRYTEGVIEASQRTRVSISTDGFVADVPVQAGAFVEKGEVILVGRSPELEMRRVQLKAELRRLEAVASQALVDDQVEYQVALEQITTIKDALVDVDKRLNDLIVRAPHEGVLVASDLDPLLGQFVKRGQEIAMVANMDDLRVTALVNQAQNDMGFAEPVRRVEMRTIGDRRHVLVVDDEAITRVKRFESGRSVLPHPSLGQQGGGLIPTSPQDQSGQETLHPYFHVWIPLDAARPEFPSDVDHKYHPITSLSHAKPGQRVYVRFTLERERPLAYQWGHKLQQLILDRIVGVL